MNTCFLGVEIGGTKIQVALGTQKGKLLAVEKSPVDVDQGAEGILAWISRAIPEITQQHLPSGDKLVAIGCGFGGPFNKKNGQVITSVHIHGWQGFYLKDWFENTFSLPAIVDNDSNVAAWGEYCLGTGKGCQHFFYTNIGSGVGGGLILDGKLFLGQGYGAGEFGHMYVPDWLDPVPGKAAVIESLCSGWAITSRLQTKGYVPQDSQIMELVSGKKNKITPEILAKAGKSGDKFALEEIDRVAHSMGIGLANVINLTNVERIGIGGGVSNLGELIIDPIRRFTQKYVFVADNYMIDKSLLGNNIVLVGAILLAAQELSEF